MKKQFVYRLALIVFCLVWGSTLSVSTMGAGYVLGEDSFPQDGVPKGRLEKNIWNKSAIYPGVINEYWLYIPAQYTAAKPASVMVFQDGETYIKPDEGVRATVVFDNLIHRREMPVTIGIFINPGMKEVRLDQRSNQYVPVNDVYARFLIEEILPEVSRNCNLVTDASGRAIVGQSDGGLCAFTVAWHRPDAFSKVTSHIGSFTRLRGGADYPHLVRSTRGNPKPLRVFLQDGENDLNGTIGNWPLANAQMGAALKFARYDSKLVMGSGGHELSHGGAIFPDTLRWIWRDYPGVKGASDTPDLNSVVGQWEVHANIMGDVKRSLLTVKVQDNMLSATLLQEDSGLTPVSAISFANDILSYEYPKPLTIKEQQSKKKQKVKTKPGNNKSGKDKLARKLPPTMKVWVTINDDTFEGALSMNTACDFEWDHPI